MTAPTLEDDECLFVATPWGGVFLRYDTDLQFWTKAVQMHDQNYRPADYYESRVYRDEREELLEFEHSTIDMTYHPKAGDD